MLTLTIFTQNRWGVWLKFLCRFKGYYNVLCGTENKTYSFFVVYFGLCWRQFLSKIFLTNWPPLWFPLYFGLQKCWRWQFLHTIVEEYGQIFYADLKVIIMCFVEQEIFSVILRIFLTNAPSLWFPSYLGLQKCWRWQFLVKIVDEYG